MKIINKSTVRITIIITSLLFFNLMYRFIQQYDYTLRPSSGMNVSLDDFERNPSYLKGKENTFRYLSYVYLVIFLTAYKTVREQIILFVLFYFIMYLTYLPFNCFCRDSKFWICNKGTKPTDKECQEVYKSVKEVDDIIDRDMVKIREYKTKTYESMLLMFPILPTYRIKAIPTNIVKIPLLDDKKEFEKVQFCGNVV